MKTLKGIHLENRKEGEKRIKKNPKRSLFGRILGHLAAKGFFHCYNAIEISKIIIICNTEFADKIYKRWLESACKC